MCDNYNLECKGEQTCEGCYYNKKEVPEETTEEQEDTIEDDVGFETHSDKYTNETNKAMINFQIGCNNFNNIGSMTFIDKD